MPGDRQMVLLDGEGVRALTPGEVGRGHGGVAAPRGQDLYPQGLVRAALEGAVVGRDRAHQEVLAAAEEQDGAVRGGGREVAHVGGAGDERCRGAGRVEVVPQAGSAVRVHL